MAPEVTTPVEVAIPLSRSARQSADELAVFSMDGVALPSQMQPALRWPDGSIRWLSVVFESQPGVSDYVVRRGKVAPLQLQSKAAGIRIREGVATIDGVGPLDLIITRHDGTVFRSSLGSAGARVVAEERGPVRTRVRLEGPCLADNGESLFDFILRFTTYRSRPQISVAVTWINRCPGDSQKIRDIRLHVGTGFEADRLVFGCQTGIYDGPFLKDWPVFILQEDHDQYWAKTLNPDGREQHLSSGGCNGDHFPGWLSLSGSKGGAGVFVPRFWEEYPNEIAIRNGDLSIGLWPERANRHLAGKPILPSNPDGEKPYVKTKYWPVLPHPYQAFFDSELKCLDVKQGTAKTQDIVLYPLAGATERAAFERHIHAGTLLPRRGILDPAQTCATGTLGILSRQSSRYARLFDECFGWFDRHIDLFKCYGKFDYGDFRYMTAAPDYMAHPGTKWGHMGEMAREGYWHNNEGDPFLGLLLYHFRTGCPAAWERCRIVARHLLDIDIRHYPQWGMYTHGYGHGYVETDRAGAPDHAWLLGLLLWAGVSGDPVAWDWIQRCGEELLRFRTDFTRVDARTVSVLLHMLCRFHDYTGKQEYLNAAQAPAEAFLKVQNADGSWPAYMLAKDRPRAPGFVDHVIAALSDFYVSGGKPARVRKALDAALAWQFASGDLAVPLVAYGLANLAAATGEDAYRDQAARILDYLDANQNRDPEEPFGRGQVGWSAFAVNNPEEAHLSGRPRQFTGQTRPLMPGFILAYAQSAAAVVKNRMQQ